MTTATPAPTAISLICDGTIRAAILILRSKGIDPESLDLNKLTAELRTELKARIAEFLNEWKAALDAHLSEGWIKELMNVQCNQAALAALKNGEWIK